MEPPIAVMARNAFSRDSSVTSSVGTCPRPTAATIASPVQRASARRDSLAAAGSVEPGRAKPSTSATAAMVVAVPITLQVPTPTLTLPSSAAQAPSSSSPTRRCSHSGHTSSTVNSRFAPKQETGRGPAATTMAGTPALSAPMIWAGMVLSQPPSSTTPSMGEARTISSTSMDIRLRRYMDEGRENGSEREIVGNSRGRPPAARTPALTSAASSPSPALQGLSSLAVLAMPITGERRTSSAENPAPRKNARCSSPSWVSPRNRAPPPRLIPSCDMDAPCRSATPPR
ncbi:hypothetical protein GCM10025784_21620 [Citricoccus nitrophenolicus]